MRAPARRRYVGSRALLGVLFVLPAFLVLTTTIVYPLVSIFLFSFQALGTNAGTRRGTPIGFQNYRTVTISGDFSSSLAHSMIVTILSVGVTIVIGMILALLLNGQFRGRGLARSVVILPWAMPTFVAAFAWRWILDYNYGAFNHIILALHLSATPMFFLGKPAALLTTSLVYAWKGVPWAAMVLLAGLQVVPQELRDAARVDGASPWDEWWRVVLPAMRFVIQIAVILLLVWNFNWFDMMWLLTGGGPGRTTAILPIDVYLQAFRAYDIGTASALSVIILIILLGVTFVMFRVWSKEEAAL
jgi:multiple sugar transport system permease protein